MSLFSRITSSFRHITVEPILFLFMFATFMLYSVFQDLVFSKSCIEQYNATVCMNLSDPSYSEFVVAIQTRASYLILWTTLAMTLTSIIVSNFLGTCSDIYSRKIPLILPPIGMVLACIVYILISENVLSVNYVILASVMIGILGGFVGCILAVMSYVAAVSETRNRTLRDGVLESMSYLGGTAGPFVGNAVLKAGGHSAVFFTMLCSYLLIVLYAAIFVEEVTKRKNADWKAMLSPKNCVSGIRTFTKPRSGRADLFLYLTAGIIVMIITAGELDVSFLYTRQAPLHWDHGFYSNYFGLKFGLDGFTLLLFMPFARRMKLTDPVIAIIGLFSKAASLVLHGLSYTDTMMFLVAPVSMFGALTLPAVRSALSKLVEPSEQGKMYAVVAAVENASGLIGAIVFNTLYPLTLTVFQGMIFLGAAAALLIPFFIFLSLQFRISPAVSPVECSTDRKESTDL